MIIFKIFKRTILTIFKNKHFMSKIRHVLNAPSREFVQNDQRGIPQLFPHTKTNLKQ